MLSFALANANSHKDRGVCLLFTLLKTFNQENVMGGKGRREVFVNLTVRKHFNLKHFKVRGLRNETESFWCGGETRKEFVL